MPTPILLVHSADVQRAGDPPPLLTGTETVQLVGSAVLVLLGLCLVAWSLRPRRDTGVSRRAPGRAAPWSRRAGAWPRAVAAASRGSAGSAGERAVAARART
jgi:hypothetical protein